MTFDNLIARLVKNPEHGAELLAATKAKTSLLDFIRLMWPVLEPGRKFLEGWAVEAICEHLEAVTRGDIRRLLINVPPGTSKSLTTNVFWPAWVWGPKKRASSRFIGASYAESLSIRDNRKCRLLVQSPLYKRLWGDQFQLVGDQNEKRKFENDKTGWRLSTSVGGVGTGERGDFFCFPGDEPVWTENGQVPISQVTPGMKVWSQDTKTGKLRLKPVTKTFRNPGSHLVKVSQGDRSVRCTPDHQFWTDNRGWVEAQNLRASDILPENVNNRRGNTISDSVFLRTALLKENVGKLRRGKLRLFGSLGLLNLRCLSDPLPLGPRLGLLNLRCLGDPLPLDPRLDPRLSGSHPLGLRRSPRLGPGHLLGSGAKVGEVRQSTVFHIPVEMANFMAGRNGTNERSQDQLTDVELRYGNAPQKKNRGTGVNNHVYIGGRQSCVVSHLVNIGRIQAGHKAAIRDTVSPLVSDHRFPILVTHDGYSPVTFCLTVKGYNTFFVGDGKFLVSNCIDDAHNIKETESDTIRNDTLQWFSEVVPTRLNDPEKSAITVIMQRVHHQDISGLILAKELGYECLCLPMEYEKKYTCFTSVKRKGVEPERVKRVVDNEQGAICRYVPDADAPLLYPQDRRTEEGELLWAERFSKRHLETELKPQLRAWGGTYAEAGQLQQRPVPRGGGMFKRENFQYLDSAPSGGATVRGWDLAASKDGHGAYTAAVKMIRTTDGKFVITDAARGRWSPGVVEEKLKSLTIADGHACAQSLPQDPGQAGKAQKSTLAKLIAGYIVHFSLESGSKEDRARPLAAQLEALNVYLVRGPWNDVFLNEMALFPGSAIKDQVDAVSRAFGYLVTRSVQSGVGAPPRAVS